MNRKDVPVLVRSVPLIDYEIERGGDGRTVTAYAATFGSPYVVFDDLFDGPYDEIINRSGFDDFLTGGIGRVKVMYNHGLTPSRTPSDKWSSPIAVPLEVKPDGKGLLTRSRYLTTPGGEEALTQWKEGGVTAQSFRGPVWRSARPRPGANGRPVIERLKLGLIEYGPAVFATNEQAGLVAIRSAVVGDRLDALADLSPEEKAELARLLTVDAPSDAADEAPVDDEASEVDAPADPGSSVELLAAEAAQRRRRS